MKKLAIAISLLSLTSCQRGCMRFEKNFQTTERDYSLVMFSGGDTVFVDKFTGIVNNSEHSDGIYYCKGNQLVEVSGDYVLTSTK